MKIKKIMSKGEMNGGWDSTEDLLDEAASAMSHNYTDDIFGPVRFEGEDGKTYTLVINAVIEEVDEEEAEEPPMTETQASLLRAIVKSEHRTLNPDERP